MYQIPFSANMVDVDMGLDGALYHSIMGLEYFEKNILRSNLI